MNELICLLSHNLLVKGWTDIYDLKFKCSFVPEVNIIPVKWTRLKSSIDEYACISRIEVICKPLQQSLFKY